MLRLVFILLLGVLSSCCSVSPHNSRGLEPPLREVPEFEQLMMLDKQHSSLCKHVFDEFRGKVKIGMTSQQFAESIKTEWVEKADVEAIVFLLGWIPLELDNSSICYDADLYPNEDGWSNHVIYFRISKPRDAELRDYNDIGKRFLQGNLQEPSVVLEEFSLCSPGRMKAFAEVGAIERFPKKEE